MKQINKFKNFLVIKRSNRMFYFLPIIFLTLISVLPLYYLSINSFKFENEQKTKLTSFLVLPGIPVFSTDDFFEYINFEFQTTKGKNQSLDWQALTEDKYKDNFLYYIYLRHIFNSRNLGRKNMLWTKALNFFICNQENKYNIHPPEKINKAKLKVSYPFEKEHARYELEVDCE